MNPDRAIELIRMYSKCPNCGNETIRPGKDKLTITENEFRKECACGFEVKLEERGVLNKCV